jgi:pimeloyl-ACP methyl ester carboxylesterase
VFGQHDAVTAAIMTSELPGTMGGAGTTAVSVPDAGHMVHFDRRDVVRSLAEQALSASGVGC